MAHKLIHEPGWTTSYETAIKCMRDEAAECGRTNRVARESMLNAIANALEILHLGPTKPTHRHVRRKSTYTLLAYGVWIDVNTVREDDSALSVVNEAPGVWTVTQSYVRPGQWARLQIETEVKLGDVVAIYKSTEDGSLWVRLRSEFEDGRFEVLP